ncbi:MAG: hypothetical protein ABSE08_10660 [Syntrophobacteraceae bacterium]|jgi:hypothetical protein
MRKIAFVLLVFWPSLAAAGIVNVEFKFTPFVGDPKADHVETVPGMSSVYINNILIAEKEVDKEDVPVLFEEREISPSVWVPAASLGPALRKGKNNIRIEFDPVDTKAAYRAQLRWASVTDQVTRSGNPPARLSETNQSGEGVDDRKATGHVVFEREFVADFATDRPWHHYPSVTTLSAEDKKSLAMLVKQREEAFKPNFAAAYQILENIPEISLAEVKKAKCLDKSYAAGIRITAMTPDQLDFVTTGNPEVVIRGKGGDLYHPVDLKALTGIKDDDLLGFQMVFAALFPARLVAVRTPSGKWEVVY